MKNSLPNQDNLQKNDLQNAVDIMIKTIAIPQNNKFNLVIPNKYVGRKIEILFYALDEVAEEKETAPKKTMADFLGSLSDATAADLHKQIEEGRNSWGHK